MSASGKTALIFGGSGAIGAATAAVLAREGARVVLGARTQAPLDRVAAEIRGRGGQADTVLVDVLDECATLERVAALAERAGPIDIVVNATSFQHDQGSGLEALSLDAFSRCVEPFLAAGFVIAKAASSHMGVTRPGVFVTVVAPAATMAMPGHLGHIVACAGVEAFSRALAAELAPRNIRVLCLRSHALPDAVAAGSYTRELFAPKAQAMGMSVEQWIGGAAASTMLNRLPTLQQVAETIAFLCSDPAGAMTGAVVNMTAGATF